jgi:hypothetical protein
MVGTLHSFARVALCVSTTSFTLGVTVHRKGTINLAVGGSYKPHPHKEEEKIVLHLQVDVRRCVHRQKRKINGYVYRVVLLLPFFPFFDDFGFFPVSK